MSAAERARLILRWLLVAAFLLAGYFHLARPEPFLRITPGWVPYPRETIMITGLCELAGAIGLLIPRLRWIAGVMLALYAVCVYPANVKHAADYVAHGGGAGLWYHIPRLAFQPVIVWWALFAGGAIDWPLRRHSYPRASPSR